MITCRRSEGYKPETKWQRTVCPVDVTVKVSDVFLYIFFIDETEKYFGCLIGRHTSVVAVASSHDGARYGKTAVSVNCHVSSIFGKTLIRSVDNWRVFFLNSGLSISLF